MANIKFDIFMRGLVWQFFRKVHDVNDFHIRKEKEGGRNFHKVSNKRLQSWDCLFKLTTDLISILFKLCKKKKHCLYHCWNSLLLAVFNWVWVRALKKSQKTTITKKWCFKTHGDPFAQNWILNMSSSCK